MSNINAEFQIPIDHPSVAAALVKRRQGGSFPVDVVQQALTDAGVPTGLVPKGPTVTTALKRAMQDATRGNSAAEVKVSGRGSGAKFTIVYTNKERLDREFDDGKGVSDAEVTGSIEFDGANGYSIKLVPEDHPSNQYIRDRHDFHCGQFSNVYDLGTWFGQQVMPFAGSIPTGSGDYFVPKGDGLDLVQKVRTVFKDLNDGSNFMRVFLMPQLSSFADTVDAITDSVLEEVERVSGKLESELENGKAGSRRLASMTRDVDKMRGIVAKFSKSLGEAFEDVDPRLAEIETLIGTAEVSNSIEV